MSAMEQSLRRALEAGDAGDPAFRDSIYTASERALERMLESKGTEPDAAHAQRVRLAETINRIEEDYYAGEATQPVEEEWRTASPSDDGPDESFASQGDAAPDDPTPIGGDALHGDAPLHRAPVETHPDEREPADPAMAAISAAPEPRTVSTTSEPSPAAASWSPGADRRPAVRASAKGAARPFVVGLVVLLLALVAGLYFVYSTVFAPMATSAPTDEIGAILENSAAEAASADEAEWINVFDGSQLELISTPNGGEVLAVTGAGDRPAVRLSAAGEGGEVGVSIGPGVVNGIKGRKVRVEITAGTKDGTPREFGVRCLFGGDTVCGRQRFTAVQASEPFVFDMTVPASPSASGTIALDPGVGAANDLDLYTLRLRDLGEA